MTVDLLANTQSPASPGGAPHPTPSRAISLPGRNLYPGDFFSLTLLTTV